MKTITFYTGTANSVGLTLKVNGATVDAGTVTRAIFRFGDYCLDTDEADADIFSLNEDATVLTVRAGLIDGVQPGKYSGMLTLYDEETADGIAWERITVIIGQWLKCAEDE